MPSGTKEPSPLSIEIAGVLRGARARLKRTYQELADTTGISRPQVSKLLDGQKRFDIEDLERLCFALGLDWKQVLLDADGKSGRRHMDL